jgi:hypothetical protein
MRYAGTDVVQAQVSETIFHHREQKKHNERRIRPPPLSPMNPLTRPGFLRVLRVLCGCFPGKISPVDAEPAEIRRDR